jgi:thiol-disulfide isomerase/thioredoxin
MRPAVFSDLEFAPALERTKTERKLLLVDATAGWCGPCQMMDRTTWVDPAVFAWLRERALAIQIDVDAQKEVARELKIHAMPTIVAFIDGKEFDRVTGAKTPKDLLAWLEGVLRGETLLTVLERGRQEGTDPQARFNLAQELARAGRYDEAFAEYVWLWEHMLEHNRALYGVRLSFLAVELEKFAKNFPFARETIIALRERVAPPASGPINGLEFNDWVCLNKVLGEDERTLDWYDALPTGSRGDLGGIEEHHIIPRLLKAERWGEAGALYQDPMVTIGRMGRLHADKLPPQVVERMRKQFRRDAALLVRALVAAGRDVDPVFARACELDASNEMREVLTEARSLGSSNRIRA